jgi:hypothetical protein
MLKIKPARNPAELKHKSIQLNYKKGNQLSSALHRIRILYKNIRKKKSDKQKK